MTRIFDSRKYPIIFKTKDLLFLYIHCTCAECARFKRSHYVSTFTNLLSHGKIANIQVRDTPDTGDLIVR